MVSAALHAESHGIGELESSFLVNQRELDIRRSRWRLFSSAYLSSISQLALKFGVATFAPSSVDSEPLVILESCAYRTLSSPESLVTAQS